MKSGECTGLDTKEYPLTILYITSHCRFVLEAKQRGRETGKQRGREAERVAVSAMRPATIQYVDVAAIVAMMIQ